MAKAKILRTDAELHIVEGYMADLEKVAHVVTAERDDADTLCALARDADLILTCYAEIPAPVIEAAAKLKGIVKYGVGTDGIDVDCATRRGVMVVNCPDYGSDTVADHAFALLMALARKITVLDRLVRDGAWVWPAPERLGVDIAGKTIGIIGMGRIGRAMARRAAGFAMEIISHSPYQKECPVPAEFVSLDELLGRSDFVSIHATLTPETRGLLGAAELKAMKPSAYLINVARGAIVDEDALCAALDEGWIAGAGIDVFHDEPLAPGYPLLGLDNVILTPHLAWYTREAFVRVEQDTMDGIMAVLEGRRPKHLKNGEVLGQ